MNKTYFLIVILFVISCKNKNSDNSNISTNFNTENNILIKDSVVLTKDTVNFNSQNNTSNVKKLNIQTAIIFEEYDMLSPEKLYSSIKIKNTNTLSLYSIDSDTTTKSEFNKSFLLGIYFSDLLYSVYANDKNYFKQYLEISKNLSYELGITSIFSSQEYDFLLNNSINDTSVQIINEAIKYAYNQLYTSNQNKIIPFVIYASWLENSYIAINSALNTNQEVDFYKTLFQQLNGCKKISTYLNKILLDTDEYDLNLNIQNTLSDLKTIKNKLDDIYISSTDYLISEENLKELNNIFASIRSNIQNSADQKMQMQMSKPPLN